MTMRSGRETYMTNLQAPGRSSRGAAGAHIEVAHLEERKSLSGVFTDDATEFVRPCDAAVAWPPYGDWFMTKSSLSLSLLLILY